MGELRTELNRLASTTGLDAQGAANVYAGTVGMDLVGALNTKAGNTRAAGWRELAGVLNQLAGTTGLGVNAAATAISGVAASATPTLDTYATEWWTPSTYDAGTDSLTGKKGTGINLRLGSAVGADTNDPTRLASTGVKFAYCPGVSGNHISTPDFASFPTGDLDVRFAVNLPDYSTGAEQVVFSKWSTTSDQRSVKITFTATGDLKLQWSTLGTAVTVQSLAQAIGVVDAAIIGVRVVLDVDNGAAGHDFSVYTKAVTEATAKAGCDSNAGWTLIATQSPATPTSIFNSTAECRIFTDANDAEYATGSLYCLTLLDGINGAIIADPNIADAAEPFATMSDGIHTWTFNRSGTNTKRLSIVTRSLLLLGTDDYLETADDARLDLAAGDSGSIVAVIRHYNWATTSMEVIVAKASGSANTGWQLRHAAVTNRLAFVIDDSTVTPAANEDKAGISGIATAVAGVRNVSADTINAILDSQDLTAAATDTTTLTLENAQPVRVGRFTAAGTNYGSFELLGLAWCKGTALTVAQIDLIEAELLAA